MAYGNVNVPGRLTAADVGAAAAGHTHTAAQVGARPNTWTPTAAEVGAAAANHTHTAAQVGAAAANHTHNYASPSHKHTAADVGAVPTARKVNGKVLSADISLNAADVGAAAASHIHTAAQVGARPDTWTPTAADVGAAAANHTHTAAQVGAVPTTRTVNGKALSGNISLTAIDVDARPNTWTPTAADVGAVPTTRTVNGKALSANISLNAADVGAAAASAVSQAYDLAMSAITTAIDGIVLSGSVATKNIVRYGVCSEGSSVGNRTVAIPGFQLVEGARISVKFDYQCNVCGPTLNVNGTGAKDILVPNLHGTWENGSIVDFIYDGTRWVIPEGISKLVEQRLGKKLDKSGGSMTGHLYAYDDTGYTTSKVRNISFGTAALTAGSSSLTSGAIKLIYE